MTNKELANSIKSFTKKELQTQLKFAKLNKNTADAKLLNDELTRRKVLKKISQ